MKTAEIAHPTACHLERVELQRLGDDEPAGLWIASLPVPPGVETGLTLGGQPTFVQPLGEWPGHEGSPRRLLLVADGGDAAPGSLRPVQESAVPSGTPPEAGMTVREESDDPYLKWQSDDLTLRWGGRTARLALGMRVGNDVHWWQYCRLVTDRETSGCRVIQMSGAIPHATVTREHYAQYPGYTDPFLHKHNWLYGHIYARLHANGVCEIYARHTNSKYFDEGRDLENAVPVIGIAVEGETPDANLLADLTAGLEAEFNLGEVHFDVSDIAHLADIDKPGRLKVEGDTLIWQPYEGMEVYGGLCPQELNGDPYLYRGEQHIIPRGMARTLRFSLSLNPERSPRVARYQAPAWWYGLCEEFSPAPLLPVKNEYDPFIEYQRQWFRYWMIEGGFEDGCMPRGANGTRDKRPEPGWEGEIAGAMMLCAYRTGDAVDHDCALRAAYQFHDLYVDHAAKLMRMHGFPFPAFALPMNRIHAIVYAYLETGDPTLLNTAKAVADNSYWIHLNAWPRVAVGRDACFMRGAVLLYRYLNDKHYLEIARASVRTVAESQFEDGSFGDQGGGTGTHGWNQYVVKPWMGLMAVGPCLDLLELCPDDEYALRAVKRFADWLLRERFETEPGVMGWGYQHGYAGGRDFIQLNRGTVMTLPTPGQWHRDYLARLMTFCSLRFGDPAYFDAWAESFAALVKKRLDGPPHNSKDHCVTQTLQYVPWVQQRLWNATLDENGLKLNPVRFGPRTPAEGRIQTPDGEVAVRWIDGEHWEVEK
ncbi:MAG: hypothetical protein ACYDCO_06000 [Armatimonadota bacterium]